MTISSTRDQLRLIIGDNDTDAEQFQDDELDYFLSVRSDNLYLAAADICEAAAARYARAYDFSADGQSFSRGQMVDAYLKMAKQFRERAGGLDTIVPTRVDGYSDDVRADDVAALTPRRYWGPLDWPEE